MKKIIVLIVVVLVAALVAPKIIGVIAERSYHESFKNMPLAAKSIRFEGKSYLQSWFSSEAVTIMSFATDDPDIDKIKWVLRSHIQHGPILLTKNGMKFGIAYIDSVGEFINFPEALQQFFNKNINNDHTTMTSFIDFNQISHDTIIVNGFKLSDEKVTATIGGARFTGISSLDLSMLKGNLTFKPFQITMDKVNVDVAEVLGTFDIHKYNDLMIGQSSVHFPLITIDAKQGMFTLENIMMSSDEQEENGSLNIKQHFSIGKVTSPIPITSFNYDFAVHHLNPKVMPLFSQLVMNAPTSKKSLSQGKDFQQLIALLFQKGVAVNQNIQIHAMGGSLGVNWDMRYVGLPNGVKTLDIQDKKALIQAISMHIVMDVDKTLLMNTPLGMMATSYIQQGLIVEKGDTLHTDIKLENNKLTVNEQAFPLDVLYLLLGLTGLMR